MKTNATNAFFSFILYICMFVVLFVIFKNDPKNDWLCKIIELCVYEMFK